MHIDQKYKTSKFRPSDDIDPKLKETDPTWSLAYMEHIYAQYVLGNCAITPTDVRRFDRNYKYSIGRQDTSIYKDMILDEFDDNDETPKYTRGYDDVHAPSQKKSREGWVNIDFENVFSPMPKYINAIIGIMESEEHDINVAAIDEHSGDLREQIKYQRYVKGKYLDRLNSYQEAMGIEPQDENEVYPRSIEELGMFEEMGEFKIAYEIGIQKAVEHTMKASGDKKIKRNVIKDIARYGVTATMDYFDYAVKEVRVKHLDVKNLIVEDSKEDDFSDISYAGYVDYITIAELQNQTGLAEEDLWEIASNYVNDFGNKNFYDKSIGADGVYDFMKCRVPVMVAFWISNDSTYYTRKKTKDNQDVDIIEPYRKRSDGSSRKPRVYDRDDKKTTVTTKQTIYTCKWVIGTGTVYEFGKAHDSAFDYKDKRVALPIHVYKIDEKPIVENCIPLVDQIALTFYRLQNGIASAPPPGLKIEYNSLMGMTFEDDQEWKPLDSLKLYSQKGHMIFNASPSGVEMNPNMGEPIQELRGGLGTVIEDAARSLELAYQSLMEITGIDRLSAVSQSPGRDQGKYVTQVAVAATNNTLRSVYSCHLAMKEMVAKGIALRVQAVIYGRTDSNYERIIGDAAVEALRAGGHAPPVSLGVHLVALPNDQLKNDVREAAMAAMAGGKNGIPALTYSEYLFIVEQLNSMSGISYARVYIAKKEAEAAMKEQKAAAESQELLNQQTQEQNQQKAQFEAQKIDKEKEKELDILEKKKEVDIAIEEVKHRHKMEQLREQKSLTTKTA
jgi:hypothetical protein